MLNSQVLIYIFYKIQCCSCIIVTLIFFIGLILIVLKIALGAVITLKYIFVVIVEWENRLPNFSMKSEFFSAKEKRKKIDRKMAITIWVKLLETTHYQWVAHLMIGLKVGPVYILTLEEASKRGQLAPWKLAQYISDDKCHWSHLLHNFYLDFFIIALWIYL